MGKHPLALYLLSILEAGERLCYYTMLAVFVSYLLKARGLTVADASSIYGTFIGLVYLSPLIGGWIADRTNYKLAISVGSLLMSIGYYFISNNSWNILYISMGLVIIGNGLFKPAISAMVSGLYSQSDSRRDNAFNIFYMGVNVGGAISGIAAGYLQETYGWSTPFHFAGIVMFLSLCGFLISHKYIKINKKEESNIEVVSLEVQKHRNHALWFMCLIVIMFWIAFHQNGSTMMVMADTGIDRTFGGLFSKPINFIYFSSLNSIFVIWLSPKVVRFFGWLKSKKLEPSTPIKIAFGMLLTGVGYSVLSLGSYLSGHNLVSAYYMVGSIFIITIAELLLSPMGLSMATKLAAPNKVAATLGIWYLATSIGNKLSGQIGIYWDVWSHSKFFIVLAIGSFIAGFILLIRKSWLEKAMPKEIDNTADDNLIPPNITRLYDNLKCSLQSILHLKESDEIKITRIRSLIN